MSDAILLSKITKNYGSKSVIQSLDLAIPKGAIFGLLGPNGAGKSTLINIIAGTCVKTSGKVFINDIDIDTDPEKAKYEIGIVPQEIVLDTFFPVREALEFYAGYYGIRPKDRKTDEIIEALGLQDKVNATSRQLSGGMKRRFLIAKALVHSPKVLILDEPTAGVDIELRQQLWDYVRKLHKNGMTIILTTHYLEEAEMLCDKIAFINKGEIVKCDYKDNLLTTLGSRKVTIELEKTISTLPKSLSHLDIEPDGKTIKFKLPGKMPIGPIISEIQSSGMTIYDVSVTQEDLEEVFRNIVYNVQS